MSTPAPVTARSRSRFAARVVVAVLILEGCGPTPPPPPPIDLPVGGGGSQCLRALDFRRPLAELITLDGQRCPNPAGGPCPASSSDWTSGSFIEYVDNAYGPGVVQTTRVTHYRITPPVPPTQSDLYVLSEITGANINDIARVGVALSPDATPTNGRAIVIQPFSTAFPPGASGSGVAPATVTGYKWTGSWTADPTVAAAVTASVAYVRSSGYWGVELRVHLPSLGITANEFYMASVWTSEAPTLTGAGQNWLPTAADPGNGTELPLSNPTTWKRYSFGLRCAPDVFMAGSWNGCGDIYVNARDDDASKIGISTLNRFFADVHGDDDVLDPAGDGQPANDVRVYMGISASGAGATAHAMNFNHTDPINWIGATRTLATPAPKPPTPFSVAAGTVNTAERVRWRPADEPSNPFEDQQHVCVKAFAYFKDDPYLDNNFAQCNMQFVNADPGSTFVGKLEIGPYYWYCPYCPNPWDHNIIVLPLITNVTPEEGPVWKVDVKANGLERIDERAFALKVSRDTKSVTANVSFVVPADVLPSDGRKLTPFQRETRRVYGSRSLVILRTYLGTQRKMGERDVTVLKPASYAGFAVQVQKQ
jgi:hypothetical protein